MALGATSDDPGWRPALHGVWWMALLPGLLARQQRPGAGAGMHGLTNLRRVFVAFAAALVLIGVVVVILTTTTDVNAHPLSATAPAIAIVVIGVAALTMGGALERPLDCSDDGLLAVSYRTRFFLRVAFSELVSLAGFVGFILTDAAWLFGLGAVFTAIGYGRLAPTASNLAKDQRALLQAGCDRSLVAALAVLPPPSPRVRRS